MKQNWRLTVLQNTCQNFKIIRRRQLWINWKISPKTISKEVLTKISAKSGNGAWWVAISVPMPRLIVTRREPANANASHSGAAGRRARHNTIDSTKVMTDSDEMALICSESSCKEKNGFWEIEKLLIINNNYCLWSPNPATDIGGSLVYKYVPRNI